MFTGLVQDVGRVASLERGSAGARLRLARPGPAGPIGPPGAGEGSLGIGPGWGDVAPGESISISGCCLTVAEVGGGELAFDVIPETLARTTLGGLRPGDRVNLERSLRAGDRLGGHMVQGHVDGVGEVVGATAAAPEDEEGAERGAGVRLRIGAGREVMEFVTPKGSITVDGVSLTVAACAREWFEVALIPETLARTTLAALKPGHRVNMETDVLARTVIHWMKNWR